MASTGGASASSTTRSRNSSSQPPPLRRRHPPQQQPEGGTLWRLVHSLRTALYSLLLPIIGFARLLITGRSSARDEYDGLSAAVTAKASQNFVAYLKSFQNNNTAGNAIGNNGATIGNGSHGGNSTSSINNSYQAWLTTGFAAAQEQAAQQQSLLLVYLHAPLHRSSEAFCKQVLCHDSMTAFINQPNVTAFGVSIHTAQGAYLTQILQASCYPFVALLQPRISSSTNTTSSSSTGSNSNNGSSSSSSSSSTMTLVLRAEGPALMELSAMQLLSHFQTALQRHQMAVTEAEARRLQRQEESALREQQDAEYQAALIADQERERMKRQEAEQEVQRLQQLQQEEERQEAQAKEHLDAVRSKVPPEPPATGSTDPVTAIRFVLPSGAKLNRRFYSHEKISGLLAFLTIYFHDNEIEISRNIGISTNYPKKSYHEDPGLTLKEAGLAPQAVLMVQDLDA
ncbi:hypothetical protein ACA910_018209 [Epithemia clementina (nom. ined.)]